MENEFDTNWRARLILQVSLLNMITPNIRGVACCMENKLLRIFYVFDGAISERDVENYDQVEGLAISHCPDGYDVRTDAISLKAEEKRACKGNYEWIYLRQEAF
ncbi:hypothetical protein J4E05_16705 [Thalassospira sp. NFXS8]|uniref:hypothetical protein n=1 Tax=Thalassospira sp. NFXS8 TaxID=2819093 RepID=UPI0032DE6185